MKTMETLQTLAMTVFMTLFKDVECWEDVEAKVYEVNPLLWPMEEELKKEWAKHQLKRKKAHFKDVHRQLVSTTIIV